MVAAPCATGTPVPPALLVALAEGGALNSFLWPNCSQMFGCVRAARFHRGWVNRSEWLGKLEQVAIRKLL